METLTLEAKAPRGEGSPRGRAQRRNTSDHTVNLALQGGGAHGAFTWGVLDRLIEDERLTLEGISATSAGAMNAVVLAYGMSVGGRDGARRALADFWRRVSHAAALGPLQQTPFERLAGQRSLEHSPAFVMFDLVTRMLSPYQFNPLNLNPLKDVLLQTVDFDALRTTCCPIKLYLSATNVRTGKVRVFDNDAVTPDAVMASACLPFMFQAVEIDGEAYWDGGYMGNPAIFPLIYGCTSPDVLIVHINPLERDELPRTAFDIMNRVNEISFNSSLMREMRAIAFVTRLIDEGKVIDGAMKRMRMHAITDDDVLGGLGAASKLNADWAFLMELEQAGRAAADRWLDASLDRVGLESTVDIAATYL